MKLTPHEEKILELVRLNPEIIDNPEARKRVAEENGLSEKTLRNRIADLKKYGVLDEDKITSQKVNATISDKEELTIMEMFQIIWTVRWKIFRNVFIMSVLAVIFSLLMPLTYRSVAVIMPPSSDTGLNLSAALSSLPFGNLIGGGNDSQGMTFIAILNSRTVQEAIIDEFDLMDFYNAKYLEDALEELNENTSVELQEEGTIKIAFTATTPWFHPEKDEEYCKELVENVANTYIAKLDEVNKLLKSEQAKNNREFIEKRYQLNQHDLSSAENRLNLFQKKYNTVSLEDQTKAAIEIASNIKAQILADQVQLEVLGQTLPENHPDRINLKREIELLTEQLNDLNTGKSKDYLLPKFGAIPDLGLEYARLTRQLEVQNQIFMFLTQQYEEAKIKEAKNTPTLQVLDYGKKPEKKFKPSRARICIIGFVFALVFSVYYYYFKIRWYGSSA